MQIFTLIHGYWRWVIAALAVVILVKYVLGFVAKTKPVALDTTLARVFSAAVGIQFVLGIINLISEISQGAMVRQTWEHSVLGIIIVALGSMVGPMLRRRGNYVIPLVLVALSLVLAYVNVTLLRGSWLFT